jgi:hypothetical protein
LPKTIAKQFSRQHVELVGGRDQRKRQLPRGSPIKLLAIERPANVNPTPTDAAVSVLESVDLHGHSFAALSAVEEPAQDVGVEDVSPLGDPCGVRRWDNTGVAGGGGTSNRSSASMVSRSRMLPNARSRRAWYARPPRFLITAN